jgi:hypothetical protein
MAGADYLCCEICGGKIVYSPEHQPEAVCKECYDTLKAKADLFDEMVELLNFAHLCVSYARIEECDKGCTDDNCEFCKTSNKLIGVLSKAKELK